MAINHANPSTVSSRFLGRNPPAYALLLAILTVVSCYTTACDDSDLKAELVPGTQRIVPNDNGPWFTISSNARWLAFMEADSNASNEAIGNFHFVTLDLSSSAKTHHRLTQLPSNVFSDRDCTWRCLRSGFSVDSWLNDHLFVLLRTSTPRSYWITFTPGSSEGSVSEPPSDLGCSDCAPRSEWRRMAESRGLPVYDDGGVVPSVPYRNGTFSDVVYRYPMGKDFRGGIIERVHSNGFVAVLLEEKRRFEDVYIESFRVSPDEQYLAYELVMWLKSPIPLPTMHHELWIYHIPTGERRRLPGEFRLMGNLIWSTDSKRLYCAVVNGDAADGIGDGVYRIDL